MSKVLATDLDGTLIPLNDLAENTSDLALLAKALREKHVTLTFVTGRHLESVQDAIKRYALPAPDWVICDVGTSIYKRAEDDSFQIAQPYVDHLQSIVGEFSTGQLREEFASLETLRLQEEEKQGQFKLSFYCDAKKLHAIHDAVLDHLSHRGLPYSLISSIDPFTGDGLIDLLPTDVSKAYALQWWTEHAGLDNQELVFSGDSGNDLAAMTAGYRTIVVGNASAELMETVHGHYESRMQVDRVYIAEKFATSGVLAGCRHFGLL
ncbi:HAD-IIB family hydrolase [Bremerella alba]|uniref:Mannosylfructose-phosphate phosphatase n=1 Tax=Bremerella alba TaxID=980252 RepID=A0A7V9A655_9BACT|nr:HAD-IIB family hydrolase [Bremerella alba]MBA2113897.1 Mannosylfructose-phosphate phosphatase [Bremerella alba]